jgi:DNA-binding transcriptional regulator PaaX
MTLEELSQRTGIDIVQLRVDLFRLAQEGKVERRQKGDKLVWSLKVSSPAEQRYEKLYRK